MIRLFFLAMVLFGFSGWLKAQEPEVERLLEQQEEYSDLSDLMEMLAELEQNPIDLNRATAEQLAALPWVSNVLAAAIINYRNQIGSFQSIEDLRQVKALDPDLISTLRKYITVSAPKLGKDFSFATKNRLVRAFGTSASDNDSASSASPDKLYNRFAVNYGKQLRFNLLLEKDGGERRLDDLRVYFLSYGSNTSPNKLILGHYRLELARGLVFGNPERYYKGSDPIFSAKPRGRELLGYTLVDENASLYGMAAQACFKIYQFLVFISDKKLDATLNSDGSVKNFYTSGYHRTRSELDKKDALKERLIGGRLQIKLTSSGSLGATYYRSFYNPAFAPPEGEAYRFQFKGSEHRLIGFDYDLTLGQFNLFGEYARGQNKGYGILAGLALESRHFKLLISGRDYSKNFISFYGNAFKEQSGFLQNEQGIYCGFQFKPGRKLELGFYFDQFQFPWRTYSVPMPAQGKDLFWRAEYRANKKLALLLQYKFESKALYVSEIGQVIPQCENRLRFQLEFHPVSNLKLRSRIEKKWVNYRLYQQLHYCYPHNFEGMLLFQDLSLKMGHKFDLAARLTFFDTDDYRSRVYQFEQDVAGVLTNKMLYGTGTRNYLKIQWHLAEILSLSIKYGSTQYYQVSSDPLLPAETTANALNCQLEIKW